MLDAKRIMFGWWLVVGGWVDVMATVPFLCWGDGTQFLLILSDEGYRINSLLLLLDWCV